MKLPIILLSFLSFQLFAEANTINFNFQNADITSVIKEYAKMSGQKFIVDANATGKITIINRDPISVEEAFNQLSNALAVDDLAISKRGDLMVITHARAVERDLIDVSTELPPLTPTKLATWIVSLKYLSADNVNRELRLLTSRDGEVFPSSHNNQLVITDYTPNLYRVAKLIEKLDVPAINKGSLKTEKPKAKTKSKQ
jgi:general secretion pathway protein D